MPQPSKSAQSGEIDAGGVDWRQRAVERSLDAARLRAEERAQRFLDAALELTVEHQSTEFTVQDVVARSRQSLRSFYQYFEGKQELLLAVFEEAMRASTAQLRAAVEGETDPAARLRRFVVDLYASCARNPDPDAPATNAAVRAMADFAFRLAATDPDRLARGTSELYALALELVRAAQGQDADRAASARRTVILLQAVMFNAFATTGDRGRVSDAAEEMWTFCSQGIGVPAAPTGGRRRRA